MKKTKGLPEFIKNECANFDRHYDECVFGYPCKVLADERCSYFEKAVLGTPNYPYRLPGYDYAKLFAQYAEQTGTETKKVAQRHCDCGEPLSKRERYCRKCRERQRRQSYRNHRRSKSLVRHS